MRKSFPLRAAGKADARVLDAIKHEVRKYVKRERRKLLPEGFVEWSFACKVGTNPSQAESVPLNLLSPAIDRIAQESNPEVYVEIVATPSATRVSGGLS